MKKILILLTLLSSIIFARTSYTVTIQPMKFFLEKIGQSKIKVKTIYENIDYSKPLPISHFRKLADSTAFLKIGLPIEDEYEKNLLSFGEEIKIVNLTKDIEKIKYMGKYNDYIWVDPLLARDIAKVMLDTLIKFDPKEKEYFETNYSTLINELDEIFLRIKNTLFYSKNAVFVFNEKWDYFLRRFDIKFYRAENEILSGSKFTKINRLSKEKNINFLLVDKSVEYETWNSWSNANNIKVLEVDIHSYEWFSNLFLISEQLKDGK